MPRKTSHRPLKTLLRTVQDAHRRDSEEWIRRMEVPADRLPGGSYSSGLTRRR